MYWVIDSFISLEGRVLTCCFAGQRTTEISVEISNVYLLFKSWIATKIVI